MYKYVQYIYINIYVYVYIYRYIYIIVEVEGEGGFEGNRGKGLIFKKGKLFNGVDSKGDIGDKESSDEERMIGIKEVEVSLAYTLLPVISVSCTVIMSILFYFLYQRPSAYSYCFV
jgi:hypothetical protein